MFGRGGFGVDPFDAVWESPDTGRTASFGRDDFCEECEQEIDFSRAGYDGVCGCDDEPREEGE